eukprot:jgi/Antlo1/1600/462
MYTAECMQNELRSVTSVEHEDHTATMHQIRRRVCNARKHA